MRQILYKVRLVKTLINPYPQCKKQLSRIGAIQKATIK